MQASPAPRCAGTGRNRRNLHWSYSIGTRRAEYWLARYRKRSCQKKTSFSPVCSHSGARDRREHAKTNPSTWLQVKAGTLSLSPAVNYVPNRPSPSPASTAPQPVNVPHSSTHMEWKLCCRGRGPTKLLQHLVAALPPGAFFHDGKHGALRRLTRASLVCVGHRSSTGGCNRDTRHLTRGPAGAGP